jgi:hypothetical protein
MSDDADDDFFSAVDLDEGNTPQEVRYGLVVPIRAALPTYDKLGDLVRDELAECEARDRKRGRQRVIFVEEDEDEANAR